MRMGAFIRAVRKSPRSVLSSHAQTLRVVMAELGQSEQRTNLDTAVLERARYSAKEGHNTAGLCKKRIWPMTETFLRFWIQKNVPILNSYVSVAGN